MAESRKFKKTKRKRAKREEGGSTTQSGLSEEKRKKLKELDKFIEGVLQEAGEEFLDEFKQVEGQ
jgi:hypothetical protein